MDRTKRVKFLRNIFCFVSAAVWVSTAMFLIIYAFSTLGNGAEADTTSYITEEGKNVIMSFSITAVIGIVASILIKDKMRTFIWMACTILSSIMFKEVGMYTILALWFVDEYILFALYKKYKNLVVINKEIDLREQGSN